MEQILARTDRKFMPIFQYRYGTGLQKLKMLVDRGLTGRPIMTTIETHWWRGPDYYAVPWRGKWATELGGGLLGHAIHAHDMLSYIQGPIAEVFAFGATLVNPIEVEDTAALSVRLANGSLAALSMTLGSREEISRLRFCFLDLAAESTTEPYTMYRDPWKFVAGTPEHQAVVDQALADFQEAEDSYTRQFQLFHEALVRRRAPGDAAGRPGLARTRRPLPITRSGPEPRRSCPSGADHPLYRSWLPEEELAVGRQPLTVAQQKSRHPPGVASQGE